MYEMSHLALVNWHSFGAEDVPISGHTGILGPNGAGKSTLLDMMQVVLSGNNGRYVRLNPAADKRKSQRTVRDYCLGVVVEGKFRREACMTYIAIGFRDISGTKPDITIGLAMEARSTLADETVYGRFVVRGRILTTQDFLRVRDGKKFVAGWEDVRQALQSEFGKGFQNHRDRPGDYVREYIRDLVPHLPASAGGAEALVKAIVNGMKLMEMSATDFVRNFILEDNPMRIGDLRESISTYRKVNQTIKDMKERAARLKVVKARAEEYRDALNEKEEEGWVAFKARFLATSAGVRAVEEEVRDAEERIAAEAEQLADLKEARAEAQQDVRRLGDRIAGLKASTGASDLQHTIRTFDGNVRDVDSQIAQKSNEAGLIGRIADALFRSGPEATEALEAAQALGKAVAERDKASAREAEGRFLSSLDALEPRLEAARSDLEHQARAAAEERTVLLHAVSGTDGGYASHLGEDTRELMRMLRVAGMAPRALCDIVEIRDPAWAQAAEGLLGRDREAIFVDRSQIAEATAILKENRRKVRRASLVSLNKLEAYKGPAEPGTFPALFESDDPDVLAFLQRRYGNVRLAHDMREFEKPGRALMADGLYDDGLVRSTRLEDRARLVIGKAAQAERLAQARSRIEELDDLLASTQRSRSVLTEALKAIGTIRSRAVHGKRLVAEWMEMRDEWQGAADQARARLEGIDMSEIRRLEEKLRAQEAYVKARDEEIEGISRRYGLYSERIKKGRERLASIVIVEGSRSHRDIARAQFRKVVRLASWRSGNARYRRRLGTVEEGKTAFERYRALAALHREVEAKAREAEGRARERMDAAEKAVRAAMRSYFDVASLSSEIGVESAILPEILPWAERLIVDIEENELTRHEKLAAEASERVASMFRGEFVNALHTRISTMEREISNLNRTLSKHVFHNERYSFRRTPEAVFAPILKAVEIYMTSEDALELLFKGDIPDDSPHKPVLDEVKRILEDPETKFEDFEDYRRFFSFEIHMEDVTTGERTTWEKRKATGSGGEQEVPLYVVVGASLASVYGRGVDRPGARHGMAPAIFDEVFSKLDGDNRRQMLSFYESLGLQVIVAAPPDRRASIMGYIHTVIEVDPAGDNQTMLTVVTVKDRVRKEIDRINPANLSEEELRSMAKAEQAAAAE